MHTEHRLSNPSCTGTRTACKCQGCGHRNQLLAWPLCPAQAWAPCLPGAEWVHALVVAPLGPGPCLYSSVVLLQVEVRLMVGSSLCSGLVPPMAVAKWGPSALSVLEPCSRLVTAAAVAQWALSALSLLEPQLVLVKLSACRGSVSEWGASMHMQGSLCSRPAHEVGEVSVAAASAPSRAEGAESLMAPAHACQKLAVAEVAAALELQRGLMASVLAECRQPVPSARAPLGLALVEGLVKGVARLSHSCSGLEAGTVAAGGI